jgi:hypothetical protein
LGAESNAIIIVSDASRLHLAFDAGSAPFSQLF